MKNLLQKTYSVTVYTCFSICMALCLAIGYYTTMFAFRFFS